MGPDKNSINTAKILGNACFDKSIGNKKKEHNICMKNVIEIMVKKDYDIIHTQETKNWKDLYDYLISIKPNYRYVCLEANSFVYLVTFYDYTKLKLLGAKYCDLDISNTGRPVILAKFKEISTNKEFISINLHASHSKINTNIINDTENYNMHTDIKNNNLFKSNLKKSKKFKKYSKASFKSLPIVLGGDTNDHQRYKYWNGLNILDKTLNTNIQPPNTCCTTTNKYYYSPGYGDYFIYSDDFIVIKKNTLIKANYPSSDHAPVDIELEFNINGNNNEQSIKTQLNNTSNTSSSISSNSLSNKPQNTSNIINMNILNSKIIFINT